MNTRIPLKILLTIGLVQTYVSTFAQQRMTLDSCYQLARENYPLIRQRDYISKTEAYTISNLQKGLLPQISLNAQTTYQSEVPTFNIPGANFRPVSKDQYKFYTEINQPLTELYTIREQKALQHVQAQMQQQNLESEMYKIRERINQLYFGILLSDEQIKLNELSRKDLQTGIDKVNAAIKNGVEFRTSLDKIKAELIRNDQKNVELHAQRNAFAEMLSYFINREINERTVLEKPSMPKLDFNINRPELNYYQLKTKSISLQEKILENRSLPHVSLFLQSGAGQPSPLNFIARSMRPFFIGGLRFNWTINHYFTRKNDENLLLNDKKNTELQRALFIFNTNLQIKQQNSELMKLRKLIESDDELVGLSASIKTTAQVQLENGIITSNDYIKEVNAEDMARQNKAMHEIQLLIAQYQLRFTTGN